MKKFKKETLKNAVQEWLDNPASSEKKYGHISNWDTSKVTSMEKLFLNAETFNEPLNNWDVSSVTTMNAMFYEAESFNQDIGSWNVSNVTNMDRMFFGATVFNQDISSWDVSSVTKMELMFYNATAFNQDTSSWDTSSWDTNSYRNTIGSAFMDNIDMAFHWFLEHNPTIEIICDEETMTQWYDFVKWSYTNNLLAVEEWSEGDTVTEGSYTFKISSLMESVVEECVDWYDNTRAEEEARLLTSNLLHARASEVSAKVCDECDGDDYYCKKCYGTGFNVYDKDIDWVHYDEAYRPGVYTWDDIKYDEIHWLHYEEALSKIFNSVDISSFEKLSKINLSKEEKNEEFLKRTKIAAISLKTAINNNDSGLNLIISTDLNKAAWGKMEAGNYNEALKNVLESIELISYSDNNDTAAMIYFHLQDFEKGLEYSNESIKINETNSEHFYNRAQILVKLDKKDLAIKDLNKAIDLDGFEEAKKLLEQIT